MTIVGYTVRKVKPDYVTEVFDSEWKTAEEAEARIDEILADTSDVDEFPHVRMGFVRG